MKWVLTPQRRFLIRGAEELKQERILIYRVVKRVECRLNRLDFNCSALIKLSSQSSGYIRVIVFIVFSKTKENAIRIQI